MEKKYESAYAQYVHKKPKTHWSSESEVKSKLLKVDLTSEHMEYGGLPIISDGKTAYIDASDSHTAIGAISGMKKSICGFMPLMCVLGKTDERIIATDPKGELYERMAGYLVACGKKVWCLDFRTFNKDGFNILEHPARVYRSGDQDRGITLLSDLINVFADKQRSSGRCDPFWPDTAAMYKNGTGKIMFDSYPDIESINISNWAEFNTEKNVPLLNELISNINSEDTALLNLRTVLSEPEKTLMSTLSTASSFLGPFIQNNKLARMLSHSTFSLDDLYNENSALFIITDDTTTTCDTIVGIIISQIQSYLVDKAYKSENGKLKHRVNFILDEFTSYPIPDMDVALATHRSRNIRYYLCVQTIDGLKKRYDHYEAILSNCGNTVFLGSTEKALLERISEQCGTTRITSDGKERPLISSAELMTLRKSWESKEAIYMNLSESIRYCATLPSIEAYEIGNHRAPQYTVTHPRVKSYTISNLLQDIAYDKAHFPFSTSEDAPEQTKKSKRKSHNHQSNTNGCEEELTEDIQKELERKFDEIFGPIDSDDE